MTQEKPDKKANEKPDFGVEELEDELEEVSGGALACGGCDGCGHAGCSTCG